LKVVFNILTKNDEGAIFSKTKGQAEFDTNPGADLPGKEGAMPTAKRAHEAEYTLRSVRAGQKVRIVEVRAEGELGRRIRDMGLVPGAKVQIVGRAPLRDPMALRLSGFTLSLRNREADHIVVAPLECAS
jgi:ferrous iron transport protein A